jgi:signal transduction histidine kinase
MPDRLRAIIVEDSGDDALLVERELRRGGYDPECLRVETAQALQRALDAGSWDIVISDFALPAFGGGAALELVKRRDPDLPFIIVSGAIGEETAVAAMKAGANDYVMKTSLGRLVPAIRRELQDAAVRRDKRRSEAALREAHRRLRALSTRMMQIQELERRTVAHELHDEVGQALTAVKIALQSLREDARDPVVAARLPESIAIVDAALEQVRGLSLSLRPPQLDDLGLVAAMRWYLDRQSRIAGLEVRFTADPRIGRLAADVETACFRIAQEAVTNVLRHAGASRIGIELALRDPQLELLVEDDGAGFDVAAAQRRAGENAGLGMIGMQERAALMGGRIDWESAPGRGTRVRARIPLAPDGS